MDKPKKYYRGPANVVYNVDGASFGMDDRLVEAIQTSIRTKVQLGTLVIPRLPHVAGRILQLSRDPEVDVGEVAKAIMTDPVLAARLLSTANSAAYGGGTRVDGLHPALARLGMKMVCEIVFTESIQSKVFNARAYREILEQSWRVSLGSAIACEALSRITGLERGGAFLIGLLHDTGKATLVNAVSELELKNKGLSMGNEIVEILLSQLHEEIGAHVLGQWGMPAGIVAAAGGHHRYRGAAQSTPAHQLIYAANLICQHLGVGDIQRDINFTVEHVFSDLGLSDIERMTQILEVVSKEMESLLAGFGNLAPPRTEPGDPPPPASMSRRAA